MTWNWSHPFEAGVIGFPIEHSLSPKIFALISQSTFLPIQYEKIAIQPQNLSEFLEIHKKSERLKGFNVTLPHKVTILKLLDQLSPEAQLIGAVNGVKKKKSQLFGLNTDVTGILESLNEQRIDLQKINAMILGAGGAARAVCFALGCKNASSVWIGNRTIEHAKSLVEHFQFHFPKTRFHFFQLNPNGKVPVEKIDLYFQTTPVGMLNFPEKSLLPSNTNQDSFVFDLIYRPTLTPFLKDAFMRGLKGIGGLDMLIWQAIGTWENWMEQKLINRKLIKNKIQNQLQSALNLSTLKEECII